MPARPWRIGTRASPLARAQTKWVADRLEAGGAAVEVVPIEAEGDRRLDRPLDELGGRGVFTAALDEALLAGHVDLAVHSLKDLPTRLVPGLTLAAVTAREDPRDAVVLGKAGSLAGLAAGARVGTSSLRRAALLRQAFPHLVVAPVRGNLGTRLAKLSAGEYDALVLAAAGLHRLGRAAAIAEYLDPSWMVPAPGQGALAVEVRASDAGALGAAAALDDAAARQATAAERRVLDALGGNCQIPVGAYAAWDEDRKEWGIGVFAAGAVGEPARVSWRGTALAVGAAWVVSELVRAGIAAAYISRETGGRS